MQNPPINPSDSRKKSRSVMLEKLQGALTDWITVPDHDVIAEFNKRNEKVKLAVVAFPSDKFKEGVDVTDAEVASHFEASKETYRFPEKRKVRYRSSTSRGSARASPSASRTFSAITRTTSSRTRRPSRFARATSCEDRRQGRRRGEEAG